MGLFDKKNIINIESEDLKDAKLSSLDYENEAVRKRAFMDVLGARLAIKMLFSKKIQANNVYSLYTIHNVLEYFDIADIYFEGIKIDVRLVFNKNEIFIPKSHFEYGLLPDLYLVLEVKEDFSSAEALGFFEPDSLDKSNQNSDFYFYPQDKLNEFKNLKSFLKKFKVANTLKISEENFERASELFLPIADKNISEEDKIFLIKQLAADFDLREKMVEFENFELISKEVAKNENVLSDGTLDIIGAQKLYEEEELSEPEEKAEIREEVLSDLLDEEHEVSNEEIYSEVEKSFEDELQETYETSESEDIKEEDKSDSLSSTGSFAAGLAVGGAVAGGVAALAAGAAASAAEGALVKGSADVLSAGLNAAGNLAGEAIKAASSISETGEEIPNGSGDTKFELPQESEFESFEDRNVELPESDKEPEADAENESEVSDIGSIEDDVDKFLEEQAELEKSESGEVEEIPDFEESTEVQEVQMTDETGEESVEVDLEEESELEILSEDDNLEFLAQESSSQILSEQIQPSIEEEDSELFALPELDLESLDEELEQDVIPSEFDTELEVVEEKKDYSEDVISLDDFDFDVLKEESKETYDQQEILASIDSDDFAMPAYMSQENLQPEAEPAQPEKEEEVIEETAQEIEEESVTVEEESYTASITSDAVTTDFESYVDDSDEQLQDESDKFISEFDDLLKDVELSDEQKELLESTLNMYNQEEVEDINKVDALFTPETISQQTENLENLQKETENLLSAYGPDFEIPSLEEEEEAKSGGKDPLQILFEEGKAALLSKLPFKESNIVEVIQQNKKMVIAASVAGVVLLSAIVGANIAGKKGEPQIAQGGTGAQIAQEGVQQGMPGMDGEDASMGLGPDLSQSNQGLDGMGPQAIPGEGQQPGVSREMGQAVSDAFLSDPVNATISKIAWEVPEDLAYNDGFRKYLQVAGRNLKLNLQNDLLLATEMAYSSKVVVDLVISPDGSLQSENIVASSGSKQIDKIVLQSVKETLKYLKMPSSELGGASASATLIINF